MSFVITFASPKGGTGKSTVARLAAVAYSQAGWDTCILDADSGQETSRKWWLRRLGSSSKRAVTSKLDCRSAQGVNPLSRLQSELPDLDIIIVDTCPRAVGALAEFSYQSDLVVIPTGTGVDDLLPSLTFANSLTASHGVKADRIRFVLNHCSRNTKERTDAIEAIMGAGFQVLAAFLSESPSYRSAMDEGLAPQEIPYWQPKAKAVYLAEQIAGALEVVTE